MSKPSTLMHPSNTALNSACLSPHHSMILPERQPEEDEKLIMQAIEEMYSSQGSSLSSQVFSPQVVFTTSTGNVSVGLPGLQVKGNASQRSVILRLLATPEALPPRTMCIDMVVASENNESTRSLLVLKRRSTDGFITSITEEEGHRKATAPLAARTAAAGNFCSPTDNMLSPCTSKLNLTKKKHHLKGKPTTLFASQLANKATSHMSDDLEL